MNREQCYDPAMESKFLRIWNTIDLEERILNGAALLGIIFIFCPWLSGEWLGGDPVSYTGTGFYTSFLGIIVLLMLSFVVLSTAIPLFGGPVILRRRYKETVRLLLSAQATILVLASLSVLTKITYEFTRMEIRFGIYFTFIGCLVTTLYTFLKWQEHRRNASHDLFHHPEDTGHAEENHVVESSLPTPPPPPAPPALEPEEHPIYRN